MKWPAREPANRRGSELRVLILRPDTCGMRVDRVDQLSVWSLRLLLRVNHVKRDLLGEIIIINNKGLLMTELRGCESAPTRYRTRTIFFSPG